MAIAFDAAVESVRTDTSDPMTWTHTPVGTPRAIVVAIVHGASATDHVSTVTYGGVSMTRRVRATDTATEPGAAELWFLGAGIPTGAQTVSADLTSGTTDDIHGVSMSFTANANTEVVDTDSVSENAANPSVTLQYGGRTCLAVAALYGGGASPSDFAENGNCTRVHDHDLGAFYSAVCRQTTVGSADFAIGGTAGSDDVALAALAVTESSVTPTIGSLTAAGVAGALLVATLLTPIAGALALTPPAPIVVQHAAQPGSGTLFLGLDPNDYRTPDVGTLTLAGVTAVRSEGTRLTPVVGLLALTGAAPTQPGPSDTEPTAGTLSLTGQTPALISGLVRDPVTGSLVMGEPEALTPTGGTLTLTGGTAGLNLALTPTVGSLTLTGTAIGIQAAPLPNVGVLTLLGQTPTVSEGPRLTPLVGGLAFASVGGRLNYGLSSTVGTLTLTGVAPRFGSIQPATGSLTLTGQNLSEPSLNLTPNTGVLFFGLTNEMGTGSLAFTTYAPQLALRVFPNTGEVFVGLSASVSVMPTGATLTLSGLPARPNPPDNTDRTPRTGSLRLDRTPHPAGTSLSLTGGTSAVVEGRIATPLVGTLTLTGQAPTANSPSVHPLVGSLTLAGMQPLLALSGSGNTNVQPDTGALDGTGLTPIRSDGLSPLTGSLALTGVASVPRGGLVPATGTLGLTGANATVALGVIPRAGSLILSGLLAEFPGRVSPGTGTLTLTGTSLATDTYPFIPTAIADESRPVVSGVAEEGRAATTAIGVEGQGAATFAVPDYV